MNRKALIFGTAAGLVTGIAAVTLFSNVVKPKNEGTRMPFAKNREIDLLSENSERPSHDYGIGRRKGKANSNENGLTLDYRLTHGVSVN